MWKHRPQLRVIGKCENCVCIEYTIFAKSALNKQEVRNKHYEVSDAVPSAGTWISNTIGKRLSPYVIIICPKTLMNGNKQIFCRRICMCGLSNFVDYSTRVNYTAEKSKLCRQHHIRARGLRQGETRLRLSSNTMLTRMK